MRRIPAQSRTDIRAGQPAALFRLFVGVIPDALRLFFIHGFVTEYQIKDSPKQREDHNRDYPRNFIGRVIPLGNNPQDHDQAQQLQRHISVQPICRKLEYNKQQKTKLHQNRQGNNDQAAA